MIHDSRTSEKSRLGEVVECVLELFVESFDEKFLWADQYRITRGKLKCKL